MGIAAGTPGGAYQADDWRSYRAYAVPRVTPVACYRWFESPREQCMAALAARALAYARAARVDRSGPLSMVKDWSRGDSTTGRGCDALSGDVRGAGAYAAIKVHKVLSVGCGAPVQHHVSAARERDSSHVQIDESWQGDERLAALTYASRARLRAGETYDGRFVIRLQDHWKPKVDYSARGHMTRAVCPGTDLQALLADDTLILDGRVIDADVQVGGDKHLRSLRLVGVQTPNGDGVFRIHLPPRIGPHLVADLHRVR
jgi:hypothetical protein